MCTIRYRRATCRYAELAPIPQKMPPTAAAIEYSFTKVGRSPIAANQPASPCTVCQRIQQTSANKNAPMQATTSNTPTVRLFSTISRFPTKPAASPTSHRDMAPSVPNFEMARPVKRNHLGRRLRQPSPPPKQSSSVNCDGLAPRLTCRLNRP